MSQYCPERFSRFREDVKVALNLYNFARKSDVKEATGFDSLAFSRKVH